MHRLLVVPESLDFDFRESFLERSSFEIRRAASGNQALSTAAEWSPALVLFSSHLRDMSSARFAEAMRRDHPTTKLLMLTDQYGVDDAGEIHRVSCDAHLLAPYDGDQLIKAVGALLDVEDRRGPRVPVLLLAQVEGVASDDGDGELGSMMANILNLSCHGMLLECERHLAIGAVHRVVFFLPGETSRLSPSCMVLFADELKLHYGVSFVTTSPAETHAIESFVGRTSEPGRGDRNRTG